MFNAAETLAVATFIIQLCVRVQLNKFWKTVGQVNHVQNDKPPTRRHVEEQHRTANKVGNATRTVVAAVVAAAAAAAQAAAVVDPAVSVAR